MDSYLMRIIMLEKEHFKVFRKEYSAKYSTDLLSKILTEIKNKAYTLKLSESDNPLFIETDKMVFVIAPIMEEV